MFGNKATWDERLELWSNRGWIATIALAVIWVFTSLLYTVWKVHWLAFLKGLSGWLIMPVLVVTALLWVASIVLKGGSRGENWSRRLFKIGVKFAGATIAIFLVKLLFAKCAQLATAGGFFQGLFVTIANFASAIVVPALVVTLVIFIVAYLAKRSDVQKWLQAHLDDKPAATTGNNQQPNFKEKRSWGGDLWN